MEFTKRLMGVALVASMGLGGLSACTDREVASAIGGLAVGAAVANAANDRDYRGGRGYRGYECVGGYRQTCQTYYDYYGRPRRECRNYYDSCASRRGRYYRSTGAELSLPTAMLKESAPVVSETRFAETHGLSVDASSKLIASLQKARNGSMQSLLDLGLSKADIEKVAKFELPSKEGVDAMARNLDQQPASTEAMLKKLTHDAKAELSARCATRPALDLNLQRLCSTLN